MSIRLKILLGFLILIILLVIAVTISIFQITNMGKSVKMVLLNNYSSIEASGMMLKALKSYDNALILYLHGEKKLAVDSLNQSHLQFVKGFELAQSHISEVGENDILSRIDSVYKLLYSNSLSSFQKLQQNNNLRWYFDSLEYNIINLKENIYLLSRINNYKIHQTGQQITLHSQKAVMPGLITIMSALVFAFMFNFFINQFIVKPLIRITEGVDRFAKYGSKFNIVIETNDELQILATSIQNLFLSHTINSRDK